MIVHKQCTGQSGYFENFRAHKTGCRPDKFLIVGGFTVAESCQKACQKRKTPSYVYCSFIVSFFRKANSSVQQLIKLQNNLESTNYHLSISEKRNLYNVTFQTCIDIS